MNIAVIGAGASGIFAALHAAQTGASITLFERNETIGKKLLVTGSGRCNLTNENVSPQAYTCNEAQWLEILLNNFNVSDLIYKLNKLGVPTYKTYDGWYYPLSNSAHSVVNTLSRVLHDKSIKLFTSNRVVNIIKQNQGFKVIYQKDYQSEPEAVFDRVIVSSGGKAYPTLGSNGEIYPIIQNLGHTITPIKPALAPIIADLGSLKPLKGIRLDAGTKLIKNNSTIASAAGNLIFTDWGLNGPAVMDISHHVPYPVEEPIHLSLNLLYFISETFTNLLDEKRQIDFGLLNLLEAFFPPKAAQCLMEYLGYPKSPELCDLDHNEIHRMVNSLEDIRFNVSGVRGYRYCQSSSGGVPVDEVNPSTLESEINPGLFLTGESLDVVGPCGGYNLHFAFASGALAGQAAGKTI